MKSKTLVSAFILSIVVSLHAATFDVSVYTDGTGTGTLRKAINDANASADASSTITFSGTPADITLTSALPNPTKNITFNASNGPTVKIIGGNFASLNFGTASKTYTFYNIIFDGNNVTGTSALYSAVAGQTINLENCQIINNIGASQRSPLFMQEGTLNLTGCTISNNSIAEAATSVIGIGLSGKSLVANLTNCTASNNSGGPVVYLPLIGVYQSKLYIDNCVFNSNTNLNSTYPGGVNAGFIDIKKSSFSNNNCYSGAIMASFAVGVTTKAQLNMENTTVSGNVSCSAVSPYTNQNGGGVYIKGSASYDRLENCTITNCTLSGNTGLSGAGLFINSKYATVTLNNCTITGNSTGNVSTSTGGGIVASGTGTTILNYCIVAGNNPASTHNNRDINIPTANLGSTTGRNLVGAGTVAFGAAGAVTAENQTLAQGTNISTILNTLSDNGGSTTLPDGSYTKTHALVASTVAVDRPAASSGLQTKDQRGYDRDATPDMGAYEISATAPGSPTSIIATAGNTRASISFTAPSNNGGAPILDYTVTSNPSNITATGSSSPLIVNGLTNNTPYTFTVTARNRVGSSVASMVSNSVTPHATNNNIIVSSGTNASSLTLTPVSDIVVSSNKLTINQTISINSITAQAGAEVTLSSGSTLNAVNGIVLQSSTSGTATFVDENLSSAQAITATVEQYLDAARNWYVTSPISSTNSPTSNITRYYEYIEAGTNDPTGQPSGSSAYWKGYNSGNSMTVGKGYIAQANAITTLNFSGTLNNNTEYPITITRTGTGAKSGFNLIGNPYMSYLDWSEVIADADNTNIIETSMWFRTYNTSDAYTFSTHNGTSGNTVTGTAKTTITKCIPPQQAFWIRVKNTLSGTQTMKLKKSMLQHRDETNNLFKVSKSIEYPKIRLQVVSGVNVDETLIYFDKNAINEYDDYDSQKMFNNTVSLPEIYTQVGTDKLVINGMNTLDSTIEVPIGFVTAKAGDFVLRASEITNFDKNNTHIVLKDKLLNSETTLEEGSEYSFTAPITVASIERFSLIFKVASSPNEVEYFKSNNIQTFVNINNRIVINSDKPINYCVYNTSGQKIFQGLTTETETVMPKTPSGVYVFKAANIISKVFVK